ncbi:unnamed protein product, partial [Staurois parvus]
MTAGHWVIRHWIVWLDSGHRVTQARQQATGPSGIGSSGSTAGHRVTRHDSGHRVIRYRIVWIDSGTGSSGVGLSGSTAGIGSSGVIGSSGRISSSGWVQTSGWVGDIRLKCGVLRHQAEPRKAGSQTAGSPVWILAGMVLVGK